ncbi:MAG: hypothetical protein IKJ16_03565 [Agathobacter sp.]|nr:hypothetical protein [Agathobacter sp.]
MIQKMRGKMWISVLALWIVMSFCGCTKPEIPYVEVTAPEETFANKYCYNLMDEKGKQCYRELYQGIINQDETIYVHGTDWELCNSAITSILYDFPEIFWIDGSGERYIYLDECIVFNPTYLYTEEERTKKQAEIDAQVNSVLAQIPLEYSEYDKAKFVYEYLVDSIEYVENAPDNQNIYSALVNKETVCAGYARANQYLLNELDIFCIYVTGTTNETVEGEDGHAWNIACINDNYYIIDVTWGDPILEETEGQEKPLELEDVKTYDYLCYSDELTKDTHFPDEIYPYPACTSNDLEYFRLNGLYYESVDSNRMKQMIKEDIAAKKGYTILQFATQEMANEAQGMIMGDWIQEIVDYYCDYYGVDEMTYYSEFWEDYNRVIIYYLYE